MSRLHPLYDATRTLASKVFTRIEYETSIKARRLLSSGLRKKKQHSASTLDKVACFVLQLSAMLYRHTNWAHANRAAHTSWTHASWARCLVVLLTLVLSGLVTSKSGANHPTNKPHHNPQIKHPQTKHPHIKHPQIKHPRFEKNSHSPTAGQLGLQYVTHCTQSARDYEAITSSPTLQANVFISRPSTKNEAAAHGPGFYTYPGLLNNCGNYHKSAGHWPIWFRVDPRARQGIDFEIIGDIVLFKNKAALQMIGDTSEHDINFKTVELFQHLATQTSSSRAFKDAPSSTPLNNTLMDLLMGEVNTRFVNFQDSTLQLRLHRYIINDLKKHPTKRQTITRLANALLHQHIQESPSLQHMREENSTPTSQKPPQLQALPKTRPTLISKNPAFWLSYFKLPFDDLNFDFLTYLEHLAKTQDPQVLNLSHAHVRHIMHQKMQPYFQHSQARRQQLIQLAQHQAQKKLSFLQYQNFWRTYSYLNLKLKGLKPVTHFQDLANWYRASQKKTIHNIMPQNTKPNEGFYIKMSEVRKIENNLPNSLPYLHIDVETFLLTQIIHNPTYKAQLQNIATQLIEQLPALYQAPVFWLSYLRLPSSVHLAAPIHKAINTEASTFVQHLKVVLKAYPHWQNILKKDSVYTQEQIEQQQNIKPYLKGLDEEPDRLPKPTSAITYNLMDQSLYDDGLEGLKMAVSLGFDIDSKDHNGDPYFHVAAERGAATIVQFFLAASMDPNLKNRWGEPALIRAIAKDQENFKVIQLLIDAGTNIHNSKSFLDLAFISGKKNPSRASTIIQTLLEAGVYIHPHPHPSRSPYMVTAAAIDLHEAIPSLVAAGVPLDAQDPFSHDTGLMLASKYGHTQTVQALLAAGAQTNLTNRRGQTALMKSAKHGHTKIVQLLLAAGADPDLKDNYGRKAILHIPSKQDFRWHPKRHPQIIQLLKAHMSPPNQNKKFRYLCSRLLSRFF